MLSKLATFPKLQTHFQEIKDKTLREFFREDLQRAEKFSIQFENIFLDYSKNRITSETLDLLLQLAEEAGLKQKIEAMFSGEKTNKSENRPVLHVALRNVTGEEINVGGANVMEEISRGLGKMGPFAQK